MSVAVTVAIARFWNPPAVAALFRLSQVAGAVEGCGFSKSENCAVSVRRLSHAR